MYFHHINILRVLIFTCFRKGNVQVRYMYRDVLCGSYVCFPLFEAQVKPHRKTESVKERRYVLTIKWRPRAHLKHDTVLPLEFKEEMVGGGSGLHAPSYAV